LPLLRNQSLQVEIDARQVEALSCHYAQNVNQVLRKDCGIYAFEDNGILDWHGETEHHKEQHLEQHLEQHSQHDHSEERPKERLRTLKELL